MNIIYRQNFITNAKQIHQFISKDSKNRADKFINELLKKIELIANMPLSFRINPVMQRDDIRDVIFKGYVIPFLIDSDNIYILDIYKHNSWDGF